VASLELLATAAWAWVVAANLEALAHPRFQITGRHGRWGQQFFRRRCSVDRIEVDVP